MIRKLILAALPVLAACSTAPAQEHIREIRVPVPAPCPSPAERARLRSLRPAPLRDQPMPPTAVERNAQAQAQLGRYEAHGGWADQVDAVLDRCQAQ